MTNSNKVDRQARLRWVPIEKMRVSPVAQRELKPFVGGSTIGGEVRDLAERLESVLVRQDRLVAAIEAVESLQYLMQQLDDLVHQLNHTEDGE